jgi:hypothetical protein
MMNIYMENLRYIELTVEQLYKNYINNEEKNIGSFLTYYNNLYNNNNNITNKKEIILLIEYKNNKIPFLFNSESNKYNILLTDKIYNKDNKNPINYCAITSIDENGNNGTFGIKLDYETSKIDKKNLIELLKTKHNYELYEDKITTNNIYYEKIYDIINSYSKIANIDEKIKKIKEFYDTIPDISMSNWYSNLQNEGYKAYREEYIKKFEEKYIFLLNKINYGSTNNLLNKIIAKDKTKFLSHKKNIINQLNLKDVMILMLFVFGCIGGKNVNIGDASASLLKRKLKKISSNLDLYLYPYRLLINKNSIYYNKNLEVIKAITRNEFSSDFKKLISETKSLKVKNYIFNKNITNNELYNKINNLTINELLIKYDNNEYNNVSEELQTLISKIIHKITYDLYKKLDENNYTHFSVSLNDQIIKLIYNYIIKKTNNIPSISNEQKTKIPDILTNKNHFPINNLHSIQLKKIEAENFFEKLNIKNTPNMDTKQKIYIYKILKNLKSKKNNLNQEELKKEVNIIKYKIKNEPIFNNKFLININEKEHQQIDNFIIEDEVKKIYNFINKAIKKLNNTI